MSVVTRDSEKVLYLFSSAPSNRPNYKMGVLNALCYPAGHSMELSYQKSYIAPNVFQDRQSWKDREGYFVFIDYKLDKSRAFIPIRKVQVKRIYPAEEARKYADTTRVYVRVQLGELILFKDSWDEQIRSIALQTGPQSERLSFYYAMDHVDFSPDSSGRSQRDVWDDLVLHVAEAKSLNDCVFLSTGPVKQFDGGANCAFAPYGNNHESEKAYQLRPSSIYELNLRVFDTRHTVESTQEIVVRSSSDLLVVSQPFVTAIGGPSDHSVLISCKRTIENTLATLEVSLKQRSDIADSKPKEGQALPSANVIAAKPLYRLSISVSRSLLVWFILLVFSGVLLTSTSKDFFVDICFSDPAFWSVMAKFVGAIFLAGAAYLGFRKLPSGS